jgi:hypothetical protein
LPVLAVAALGTVTFEKRPLKLYLTNNASWLIALLVMGASGDLAVRGDSRSMRRERALPERRVRGEGSYCADRTC